MLLFFTLAKHQSIFLKSQMHCNIAMPDIVKQRHSIRDNFPCVHCFVSVQFQFAHFMNLITDKWSVLSIMHLTSMKCTRSQSFSRSFEFYVWCVNGVSNFIFAENLKSLDKPINCEPWGKTSASHCWNGRNLITHIRPSIGCSQIRKKSKMDDKIIFPV